MNIALIDDSVEDMNNLSSLINKYFMNTNKNMPVWICSFEHEDDFLNHFKRYDYDMIFIDYYLSKLTGMELAMKIRDLDKTVVLIFTTVSRDFAIDSYLVKASGYLVKPITYHRFEKILDLIDCKKLKENQFIEVSNGMGYIKIFTKDIIYCDVSGHYTKVHTTNKEVIKCRQSFAAFAEQLTLYPEFIVCYRGCIINMMEVKTTNELCFLMSNGENIPFRTKQKAEIMKRYTDFLFERNRKADF